ncbi:hypothetical protein [Gluconobacter cerinus]|uniref:Uncharacterized protein n=1 Tax=Gluconobacter cerinus TaxID=38307 RepID=A0AAV5NDV3_9PROT|nr:hypothetical protein [Gluconobacter cerinus]GBR06196.1 hypothetical protein AA0229_2481 [Gluconobacter cerinus NRIC 0229]GLQ62609.1 hypothetical protein GCM10007867_14540 [Gluconobacter cerinus]
MTSPFTPSGCDVAEKDKSFADNIGMLANVLAGWACAIAPCRTIALKMPKPTALPRPGKLLLPRILTSATAAFSQ